MTSTGDLRIGGNSLRSEFFNGLIDEVRIYDRPALARSGSSPTWARRSPPDATISADARAHGRARIGGRSSTLDTTFV